MFEPFIHILIVFDMPVFSFERFVPSQHFLGVKLLKAGITESVEDPLPRFWLEIYTAFYAVERFRIIRKVFQGVFDFLLYFFVIAPRINDFF